EIDSVLRNAASGRSLRPWSKDAGRVGAGHQRAMLNRFTNYEAVHIDQQNQASVRSNGRAGEYLYVAHVFAKALDYDFIFANHVLHTHANLTARDVDDHHAEVAVNRLNLLQAQGGVEADNLGHLVANFGQQLAAYFFHLAGF